jgi:lipid-A-disaccharide synthase
LSSVFVSAGEVSGDLHAAAVVDRIRRQRPDLDFFGLGGETLRAEGTRLLYDLSSLAVTGFWEVVKQIAHFRKVYRNCLNEIERVKPDLVLLVDYPGMNLRLAEAAKALGCKVVYYILPQVWAWKAKRIRKLENYTDLLLAIIPFEPELFDSAKVKCEFVGHPLLELEAAAKFDPESRKNHGIAPDQKIIALLPGSRKVEVDRHYEIMLRAAKRCVDDHSETVPVLLPRAELGDEIYDRIESRVGFSPVHWQAERYDLLKQTEVALVKSGTATLEVALKECPFCIVYRTGLISYLIARSVIKLRHVGLANIVAGKQLVPEFLQYEMNVENLYDFCIRMLECDDEREKMIISLRQVRTKLGTPGAADRAAELILRELPN